MANYGDPGSGEDEEVQLSAADAKAKSDDEMAADLAPMVLSPESQSMLNRMCDIEVDEWFDREETLEALIRDAPMRKQLSLYLEHLGTGGRLNDFLDAHRILWADLSMVFYKKPELTELVRIARKIGEVFRTQARIDEAHRRAVDGTPEPRFHKGVICGYVQNYSDSLLAMLIKADDPDKFADRKKVDNSGIVLHINVEGVEMGDY